MEELELLSGKNGQEVKILDTVAADWEQVAVQVGFEASEIRILERDHANDARRACWNVFNNWLHCSSDSLLPPTWSSLWEVMKMIGHMTTAHCLREIIEHAFQKFYLDANDSYIQGNKKEVCALCFEAANIKDSHIFPNCMLKAFFEIHCKTEQTEATDQAFIFDLSRGMIGAGTLTYPLFCGKCEERASREEGLLRDIYVRIMSTKNGTGFRLSPEESKKLKHILAVIMFRGILLGINFEEYKGEDGFWSTFRSLHTFCKNIDDAQIEHNFFISILSNGYYSKETDIILNWKLRNPRFTTVEEFKTSQTEKATFFYTSFDCFHCALSTSNHSVIKRELHDSCSFKDGPFIFSSINSFPNVILDVNQLEIPKYLRQLRIAHSNHRLGDYRVITGRHMKNLDSKLPPPSDPVVFKTPTDIHTGIYCEEELSKAIKAAGEMSSLKCYTSVQKKKEEKKMKAKNEKLQYRLKQAHEQCDRLKKDNQKLTEENCELKKVAEQCKQKDEQIEALRQQLSMARLQLASPQAVSPALSELSASSEDSEQSSASSEESPASSEDSEQLASPRMRQQLMPPSLHFFNPMFQPEMDSVELN